MSEKVPGDRDPSPAPGSHARRRPAATRQMEVCARGPSSYVIQLTDLWELFGLAKLMRHQNNGHIQSPVAHTWAVVGSKMLKNSRGHRGVGRKALGVAAMTAVFALAVPAVATAAPDDAAAGSLESVGDSVDLGSAALPEGFFEGVVGIVLENGIPADVDGLLYLGTSILNSTGSFAPTQPCSAATQSGGAGVTTTKHELGKTGPTSFKLRYDTRNIPDKIEVLYQGRVIHDTNYVGNNNTPGNGVGTVTVNVPAGTATNVMVRVTGPDTTLWDYTVNCPA